MYSDTLTKLKEITNFIENDLIRKIRKDLWHYEISNERDFESIAYYHLRSFLKKFPEIKISTNYVMEGLDVWKEADKTKKWKKVEFIMPDIVISERSHNEKKPLSHLIAFELKTRSPGEGTAPTFSSEEYELDFRKLNRLMRAKKIKRAYYLLVYSDPKKSEKVVVENINECWISRGKATSKDKAKRTKRKHFKSFVFNRYVDPETKKIVDSERKRAEIQYKGMKFYRTYYSNTEKKDRLKKLKRLEETISNGKILKGRSDGKTATQRHDAAVKAALTRKRNEIAKRRYGCKYEELSKTKKIRVDKIRKRVFLFTFFVIMNWNRNCCIRYH